MAEAYEGDRPFIFISYAHADGAVVRPIIDALDAAGYRVWFDEGIEWAAEWPQNIADHLYLCSRFLAFMSQAAARSDNCGDEIYYALDNKKEMLVAYIDDVDLNDINRGLKMRLGKLQHKTRGNYPSDEAFVTDLLRAKVLEPCLREEVALRLEAKRKAMAAAGDALSSPAGDGTALRDALSMLEALSPQDRDEAVARCEDRLNERLRWLEAEEARKRRLAEEEAKRKRQEEERARREAEEARKAEEARLAEEARRAEEARLAEEARRAEEARLAEEARRAEEARLAEEARKAEERRRMMEEARKAAAAARMADLERQAKEEAKEPLANSLPKEVSHSEETRMPSQKAAVSSNDIDTAAEEMPVSTVADGNPARGTFWETFMSGIKSRKAAYVVPVVGIAAALLIAIVVIVSVSIQGNQNANDNRSHTSSSTESSGSSSETSTSQTQVTLTSDSTAKEDDNLESSTAETQDREYYWFGSYEQDGDSSNGAEEIKWRVLDRQDDRILLISEYALDARRFDESSNDWDTSELKAWLEGEFEQSAFNDEEVSRLASHPFCLSVDEANSFFEDDDDRVCYPTTYAKEQGEWTDYVGWYSDGACDWWLGVNDAIDDAFYVRGYGDLSVFEVYVSLGVRPALWLNL